MRDIHLIYLFKFLKSMYFFSGVLIPFFTEWGGITFFQVMLLQTWFVFWTAVLEVPTGAVADRWGYKTSILYGLAMNVLAVIVYVLVKNFYVFLFAEFLWALSAALMSGADVALIYEKMKAEGKEKETKKALGRYSTFELIGIAVATPIGSIIGQNYGLQYSTLAMVVPLSFAMVAMLFVKSVPQEKKEHQHYLKVFKEGWSYFWQNRTLRALAFDSVSISIIAFMAIWTYQPQLKSVGIGLAFFGVVHAAGTLMEILVLNNFTFLEKTFSTKGYLLVSGLVVGISFMLLTIAGIFSPLFIALIFGFGFTRRVLLTHYINKHIKAEQRATVLSSVSMLDTLGRAILYPLVGIAAMWNLNVTHLSLGILVLAALVFSKVKIEMLSDL